MTKKNDPLSNFLLASAVVLGLMYFLESKGRSELDQAQADAAALTVPGCQAGTAGPASKQLVLRCDVDAAEALASLPAVKGFEAIWIQENNAAQDVYKCPSGASSLASCVSVTRSAP